MDCMVVAGCSHISRKDGISSEAKEYELEASARQELFMSNGKMAATDSSLVVGAFLQPDVSLVTFDLLEELYE